MSLIKETTERINLSINFWIKSFLSPESFDTEKELQIFKAITELENILIDLENLLNDLEKIDCVTAELPNVGEFLSRLCTSPIILLHGSLYNILCRCVLWFNQHNSSNPLHIKAQTWAQCQLRNTFMNRTDQLFGHVTKYWNCLPSEIGVLATKEILCMHVKEVEELKENDLNENSLSRLAYLVLVGCHIPEGLALAEISLLKLALAMTNFKTKVCGLLQHLLNILRHYNDDPINSLLQQIKTLLWLENEASLEEQMLQLIESLITNPLEDSYKTLQSSNLIQICVNCPKLFNRVCAMLFSLYLQTGCSPRICSLIMTFSNSCHKLMLQKELDILKLYDPVLWPLINLLLVNPTIICIEDCYMHIESINSCLHNLPSYQLNNRSSQIWLLWLQFGAWHWKLIEIIFVGKLQWLETAFSILQCLYKDSLDTFKTLVLHFRKQIVHPALHSINSFFSEASELEVRPNVKLMFQHCLSIFFILKGDFLKIMENKSPNDFSQSIDILLEDSQSLPYMNCDRNKLLKLKLLQNRC